MKIAFIGGGVMGEALIKSIVSRKIAVRNMGIVGAFNTHSMCAAAEL